MFLTKISSKYINTDGMQLASLEIVFQYESNDTNYVKYNQDFLAQFFQPKFVLKCACALFIEMKVVYN
jgi:hypothetical protein